MADGLVFGRWPCAANGVIETFNRAPKLSYSGHGALPTTVVGRYRSFVAAYHGPPAQDAGAQPSAPGTGWQSDWNASIAADAATLASNLSLRPCQPLTNRTWTDAAGNNEKKPINCITWYEAFAFCVWDGGFLPTELQWQYAAAAGTENRTYPWVGTAIDTDHALYGYCGHGVSSDCTVASIANVGSKAAGAGKWGQLDLAGSMWEWAFDAQPSTFPPSDPCDNCISPETSGSRSIRGGSWYEDASYQTTVYRIYDPPDSTWQNVGVRCARVIAP